MSRSGEMSGYTAPYARNRIAFNRNGQSIMSEPEDEYSREDAGNFSKPRVDSGNNRKSEINHITVKGRSSARDAR